MTRILSIIAFLLLLCAPHTAIEALGKQKKQKPVLRLGPPEPDQPLRALHPDHALMPVHEPGRPRKTKAAYVGNHKAMNKVGIDVSHYQGQIDWSAVAHNKRILFAYCKATENVTLVDNTFLYNAREIRKSGIPVGCYHFFSPSASGASQLKHFMEVVDMNTQDLIPVLDVEVRGKAPLQKFHGEIRAWLEGFEQAYHFKPMIYCSANFYNKYLVGVFDDYKFMFAKYSDEMPNPNGPVNMVLWQYSANERINGVRGAVDISTFCDNNDLHDILIKNQR